MFNRPVGNPGSVRHMFSKTFAALEEMQNHALPITVDNLVDNFGLFAYKNVIISNITKPC